MKYASYPSHTWPNAYVFSCGTHKTVAFAKKAYATVQAWRSRSRQRRRPTELDDRLLNDIGVSRVDVWVETTKPCWKV